MGSAIFEKIEAHLQSHRMGAWTGTFRDYLALVIQQPSLALRAHARLYNVIKGAGVQVDDDGKEHYEFFDQDLFGKVAMANRRGEPFDYTTHEKLKEAIEKQLFAERRDTIKLTIASRNPDTEQLCKLNEVIETLVTREDYCSDCANELLKYVSSLLAREK